MDRMTFNSSTIVNKKMYFISNFENILAYMDMENGKISYLKNIKGFSPDIVRDGIEKVIEENGKIYFFILDGKSILIYDIEKNSCKTIHIDFGKELWGNYAAIIQYNKKIFLFPSYKSDIIKIDTEMDEVVYEKNIYDKLVSHEKEKVFCCGCQVDNNVYLFGEQDVAIYNLITDEYKRQKVKNEKIKFIDVVNFENKFYFTDKLGRIYQKDTFNGSMEILFDANKGEYSIGKLVSTKKNLWILPSLGEKIYVLDYKSGIVSIYENYPYDLEYYNIGGTKYHDFCKYEKKYYVSMRLNNYILTIDEETGLGNWIKPKNPDLSDKIKVYVEYQIIHKEEITALKEFINSV